MSVSLILKSLFCFGTFVKIFILSWSFGGDIAEGWDWVMLHASPEQAWMGRSSPGIQGSTFARRGADLHIPTLWNHIILMRMQMKRKRWEMALAELLVTNVFLGRGVMQGGWTRLPSLQSVVCRGTRVGWHMAKSEGSTSSLMCLLLLVLIHGI